MEERGEGVVNVCRGCNDVLIPPDPSRKYRTIKCEKCKEVTAVGPPPEDKKYVICSCNALLIIPDDASIFTCTRCKKTRSTVQLMATASGGLVRSGSSVRNLQSSPSSYNNSNNPNKFAPMRSPSLGQNVLRSYSVGTLRNTLFRTVSNANFQMEDVPAGLEASSGTISPKSFNGDVPNFSSEGAEEMDTAGLTLNEDQQYLVRFLASRVRPSIIKYIDGDKFWFMRLKVLLLVGYNIAMSILILTNTFEHSYDFRQQFGFEDLDTWLALVLFVPYIGCFIIEWAVNKVFVFGFVVMLWYASLYACIDPLTINSMWNFFDLGHLLEESLFRSFFLRIPRLNVPVHRMFNPPSNSQIESEFFFLSDAHLISLVFKHPRIHFFFKFWLGFFLVLKTLGRAGCIVALIILPSHPFTIIYAAETFASFLWMVFWWLVTNKF